MSDFDLVLVGDKMDLIITDLVVLNKKEKAPPKYLPIEPPIGEGGRFSFQKRYLAYTKEVPTRLGRVGVTDIKIVNSGDKPPLGYRALSETMDDNIKPFTSKVILVKLEPLEDIKEAVTDVVVLSGSKTENVPNGYKRLPEVNGFSICFQIQKIEKKAPDSKSRAEPEGAKPDKGSSQPPPPQLTASRQVSAITKKHRSAIDGLTFQLNSAQGVEGYLKQFLLPDLQILSFDEINEKFKFDWDTLEEQVQS